MDVDGEDGDDYGKRHKDHGEDQILSNERNHLESENRHVLVVVRWLQNRTCKNKVR